MLKGRKVWQPRVSAYAASHRGSLRWASRTKSDSLVSSLSMMPCTPTFKAKNSEVASPTRLDVDQRRRFSAFIRRGLDGRCIRNLPLSHRTDVLRNRLGHSGGFGRF